MILPEHRTYMLEIEDRQDLLERPVLDEDELEELNRQLGEAMHQGLLVTLRVFSPTGIEEIDMVPQRVMDGKLRGLDREGDRVSVYMVDVVGIASE
jgi:hypothetical protein